MRRIVLSKLADDYKKQKRGIFEFGKNITRSNHTLTAMDISKLEDATLHNLGAERSAGFINYEFDRRESCELSATSYSQLKYKSQELIEKSKFKEFEHSKGSQLTIYIIK